MRSNEQEFRSEISLPSVAKRTGGTTGDPWTYALDRQAWAHMYAAGIHFWELLGCLYGERIALLGTPPSLISGATGWKGRLRRAVERRGCSSTGVRTDHEASLGHARAASASRGVLWYGYASMFAGMADAVLGEGLSLRGPRAIVTTSEPLLPDWRRRIEGAFGAPVYDQYGCNDGGVLAQTCHAGRFHVAENVSLLEVFEGDTPCPPGVEGELVVTNLHARVIPFLRYRVGDRAVLGRDPCPCGRRGTTLERILGRTGDRLRLPGGTEISLPGLTTAFWNAPNVRRWQLVQPEIGRIRVRLELADAFDSDEAARLEADLQERCGDAVAVELVANEPFERTPAGKLQVLISRV
jgi:phenylacetate-CoA ligase